MEPTWFCPREESGQNHLNLSDNAICLLCPEPSHQLIDSL